MLNLIRCFVYARLGINYKVFFQLLVDSYITHGIVSAGACALR